jgi:hypothetical protein
MAKVEGSNPFIRFEENVWVDVAGDPLSERESECCSWTRALRLGLG